MLERRVAINGLLKVLRSRLLDRIQCTKEAADTRQLINIDELIASPWIGLHYRYEFLLHHSHQLLEQQPRVRCRSSDMPETKEIPATHLPSVSFLRFLTWVTRSRIKYKTISYGADLTALAAARTA
ncbi:hypothetical protein [Arthrobacter sp. 4R501]|uniref:hypothetical protein n=1 Tax=Arthrobacter sp. 4R501 TaxID=2058886 RepID=UPI000CE55CA4|nr:hypothetical protein [Arthrobacter sp. 4R501]